MTSKRNSFRKLSRSEKRRPKKRKKWRRNPRKSLKRVQREALYLVKEVNHRPKRLKKLYRWSLSRRKKLIRLPRRSLKWRMLRHKPIEATTKELKSSNNKREWCKKWRINKLGCDNKHNNNWSQELWLKQIRWGSSRNHKQHREITLLPVTIIISASLHTNRKMVSIKFLRSAIFRICVTTLKSTNLAKINNSYIRDLRRRCHFRTKVLYIHRKMELISRIVAHYKAEILCWNRIWFPIIKLQVKVTLYIRNTIKIRAVRTKMLWLICHKSTLLIQGWLYPTLT